MWSPRTGAEAGCRPSQRRLCARFLAKEQLVMCPPQKDEEGLSKLRSYVCGLSMVSMKGKSPDLCATGSEWQATQYVRTLSVVQCGQDLLSQGEASGPTSRSGFGVCRVSTLCLLGLVERSDWLRPKPGPACPLHGEEAAGDHMWRISFC